MAAKLKNQGVTRNTKTVFPSRFFYADFIHVKNCKQNNILEPEYSLLSELCGL